MKNEAIKKPYVICHMASTINGKILTANWGDKEATKVFSALYEQCHQSYDSQAWMCGRVTMEKDFSKGELPVLINPANPIERKPFIGNKEATSFAVSVDAKGKLGWKTNELGGDHIIQVLTEEVSDAYLSYLQQKKVSYIFAGKKEVDFNAALEQLAELFSIQTIMLEGGGHINGSMLNEDLIDELSILVLPIADTTPQTPTTFEYTAATGRNPAELLELKEVKQLEHGVLWLKYTTKGAKGK